MSYRRSSKKRSGNIGRYRKIIAFVLGLCLLMGVCQPGVLASVMTDPVYKITFHDMDMNGNEWKQSRKREVSIYVPDSGSIWQVLQGKKRTIGTDKQKIQDCVWYTLDEDGERAVFDLDEPIMEDLDLYTYSYGVRLIDDPAYADFWAELDPEVLAQINSREAGITGTVSKATGSQATASNAAATDTSAEKATTSNVSSATGSNADHVGGETAENWLTESWKALFQAVVKTVTPVIVTEERATSDSAATEVATSGNSSDQTGKELPPDDVLEAALTASRFVVVRESQPLRAVLETEEEKESTWTDLYSGEDLDKEDILEHGVTENYLVLDSVAVQAADALTLECYADLDGAWQLVSTITVTDQSTEWGSGNNTRWYVTASELEQVYSDFGFSRSQYNGERYFPHVDQEVYGQGYIWADQTARKQTDGEWHIPLCMNKHGKAYLYYLPHNRTGYTSYFTDKKSLTDNQMLTDNSFVSLSVEDQNHLVYSGATSLPAAKYGIKEGETLPTLTMKVEKIPDEVGGEWLIYDAVNGEAVDGSQTEFTEEDGAIAITIKNMTHSVKVTPEKDVIAENVTINCYIIEDGEEKLVETRTSARGPAKETSWGSNARYFMLASELEEVYGTFGFRADTYHGERIFPHTDSYDQSHLWADATPVKRGANWRIPLSHRNAIDLFYLPNNIEGNTPYFPSKIDRNNTSMLTANSFYSLTVKDDHGLAYDNAADIPKVQYVMKGGTLTVTVPKMAGGTEGSWKVIKNRDETELTENTDYTKSETEEGITYTFSDVSYSVTVKAVSSKSAMIYQASMAGQIPGLTSTVTATAQSMEKDGTVQGFSSYYEYKIPATGDYTVLAPDRDYIETKIFNNRHYFYTFDGWKLQNGTNSKIVKPGETLSQTDLETYKNAVTGEITLTAVWRALDTHNRIESVNFYLSLDCEIRDNQSDGYADHPADSYTSALYATRVFGGDTIPSRTTQEFQDQGGTDMIAPENSGANAYEVDQKIRNLVTEPVKYQVKLENFPSDESIFEKIRNDSNYSFKIDGEEISKEKLTTEYFAIRWGVFKYQESDGWHIDGALVARKARFQVTKTFDGDDAAIDKIINQTDENAYKIVVSHEDDTRGNDIDYELYLKPKGDTSLAAGQTGYDSYDAATKTYTWMVEGRQGRTYYLKEENYILADTAESQWNNTSYYMIINSEQATNGWKTYNDSTTVSVVAEAYPSDIPDSSVQTVEFQNLYVQAGVLTVSKVDYSTKHGMKDIAFTISREDEMPLAIYRKPGTNQYAIGSNGEYTEPVYNNVVKTGSNGFFYIALVSNTDGTGITYNLEEEIPVGYDGAKKIQVTVTDSGSVNMQIQAGTVIGGVEPPPSGSWIAVTGHNLVIYNYSKLLTNVTVKKDWGSTLSSLQEKVTVELWQNGAKMQGTAYTQSLDSSNEWTYTWKNLPLFMDGELTQYSLRETTIGSAAYDSDKAADGGYEDYMVSYDPVQYWKNEGTYRTDGFWTDSSGNYQYANNALLVVHNRPKQNQIMFKKTDIMGNALSGAVFALYTDEACSNYVASATSDTNGFVTFQQQAAGTYYMKETRAPEGYVLDSTTIYCVTVHAESVTIGKVIKSTEGTVSEEASTYVTEIINTSKMSLTIQKVDSDDVTKTLTGADFQLWRDGSPYIQSGNTENTYSVGADGTITIDTLQDGDYRIAEAKAPIGYNRRNEEPILRVENGTMTFVDSGFGTDSAWNLVQNTDPDGNPIPGSYTLTVKNVKIYTIPSVGGPGIYFLLILGTALMCLAAAILLLPAPKKEKNAKRGREQ